MKWYLPLAVMAAPAFAAPVQEKSDVASYSNGPNCKALIARFFKHCLVNIYPLALNVRSYEHSEKYSKENKDDEEYEHGEEKEYKKEAKKYEHGHKESKEYKHKPKHYKEHEDKEEKGYKKYESSKSLPRQGFFMISALLIWNRGEET